jgi:hypothetical protein
MSLGEVAQVTAAFVIVQAALNWLVESYSALADCLSSVNRVASLLLALDALEIIQPWIEVDAKVQSRTLLPASKPLTCSGSPSALSCAPRPDHSPLPVQSMRAPTASGRVQHC